MPIDNKSIVKYTIIKIEPHDVTYYITSYGSIYIGFVVIWGRTF